MRPLRMSVGAACCLYSAQAILGVNEFVGQFIKNLACCYGIHCRFCDLCVSKCAFSFTQCSKIREKCRKIASKTL